MKNLLIRRATEDDLDPIYEINLIAWKEMSTAYMMEQKYGQIGPKPANVWRAEGLRMACAGNLDRVFVAELEGEVVGYAMYMLDEERRIGTVGENAVHPDYRGRGIATALQRKVQETFREAGMRFAQVMTLEHDIPAQHVYEKVGFREFTRTINYVMEL